MTDLIKMIEEKILNYKNYGKHPKTGKYFYISEITNLEWLLSELKKRNCEGCKFSDKCIECIELKDKENEYQHYSIDYCSNWEAK